MISLRSEPKNCSGVTGGQLSQWGSDRVAHVFSVTEPLWVSAASALVVLSYLLQMNPAFTWGALAVAFLPFLLRLLRYGYQGVKTPFDPAVALMVTGGLVGLLVSPTFGLSLGAFQSLIAVTLVYYSICNHRYPASLIRLGLPLAALALLAAALFAFSRGSLPPGKSHGLALSLLIAAAIGGGFAAFGKRLWLRLTAGLSSAFSLIIMVPLINLGIINLFTGESIASRIPLWQDTIQMLKDHPFSGLGLGSWASLYHSAAFQLKPTHPHNAYLELYANGGVLGALAFLVFSAVAIRLGWDVLRSSRSNPWYGLGVGVILAYLCSAIVGLVESSPAGIPLTGTNAYFYVVSPLPWMLAALLVVTHRLLREESLK